MKPVWIAAFLAVILALSAIPALAQPVISAKSGLISYVEGKVYLGDQIVEPSPTRFPDVKENAVVRTAEGRAEVLLTPGVVLRLGENSSFKMLTNRLIDTRLELLTGSAVVEADDIAKDTNVTLVSKDGTVLLAKKGLYRFDTAPARLKVLEGLGSAQVAGQQDADDEHPDQALVVADAEHSRTMRTRDPVQGVDDDLAVAGVERTGRLVGEQQLRFLGQRARDRDALFLATGKFGRTQVHAAGEAEITER